jgi:2OG-Fe dioxygenase
VTPAKDLATQGWCLTTAAVLGWPEATEVLAALSPALADDPRGPGKQHARDVIRYEDWKPAEASSIAFTTAAGEVIDDFSRFRLLDARFGPYVAKTLLDLLQPTAWGYGEITADLFHYSAGAGSPAHRDGFGEYVVIWVLGRTGEGGESFLLQENRVVFDQALEPGEVLVFRDELFLHGVQPMLSGTRDVLIFISVKP